jgi:hypothetical protein
MKKLLLLLPILFVGCGGDDETNDPTTTQEQYNRQTIIGRWVKFAQASSPNYDVFREVNTTDTLIFETNGKYTQIYQDSQTPFSGEYSVTDKHLTLSRSWTYDISFDDTNTMRLKEYGKGIDNYIMKYKRLR